jgi:carbon storage regulator
MLILARSVEERIFIGDDIVVTVLEIGRGRVRLGIDAPPDVAIVRAEIAGKPPAEGVRGQGSGVRKDREEGT